MKLSFFQRTAFLAVFVCFQASIAQAQNNIGIGTTTPAASAQLDVTSTTKGVLVPRVTTAQMNAIASPANGLLVYNTTTSSFAYRTASGWVFLTGNANAANGWSTQGNAGTNAATNFIGTTDNQPVVVRQNNIRAGMLAGNNTSWGVNALNPASTGTGNTANGASTLFSNTTGNSNSALGVSALRNNTTGDDNTASGREALFFNTTGVSNTANGRNALFSNTTGNTNTANGDNALLSNTTGFSNVAVGTNALNRNTTRSNLVAIGDSALFNNGLNATENFHATRNTAVGSKSLFANTLGFSNTATGADALRSNTGGFKNTANGVDALLSNTTGILNTAIGTDALRSNDIGEGNTANGVSALRDNTTGGLNTANGLTALASNTTGTRNTANGSASLNANTTGSNNTANGASALALNTTGSENTALGRSALFSNTNRSNLVAIGDSALYNNGVGASGSFQAKGNTAIGSKALFANTTGFDNTANGFHALYNNSTGKGNTAIGSFALEANFDGVENTALGTLAGGNASGSGNMFLGHFAGYSETGSNKLYINNNSGNSNNALIFGEFDTDKLQVNNKLGIGRLPTIYPLEIRGLGEGNELIKFFNTDGAEKWHFNLLANGSLNIVESGVADNRMVLGAGGEVGVGKVPLTTLNDSRFIVKQKGSQNGFGIESGNNTNNWSFYVSASHDLYMYYNGSYKGAFSISNGAYTLASDRRLKKDITAHASVLEKINQLEAFNYHYIDNESDAPLSTGFMAQDVQKLFPEAVSTMDMKNGEKMLGINYQYFTVAAIKGLQEQQAKIETLEAEMTAQKERMAKLEALLTTLSARK